MRSALALALVVVLFCPAAFATEREVSFVGAREVQLSGTLLLPPTASSGHRVPAVLLVPGSGPTDRNGNQPPLLWTGLLKQTADALASTGMASLRFDKRGVGRSTRPPKDFDALVEFTAWDHFIGDVTAACAALRAQPEVDPSRVVLIGHSEGGLLVMHAAVALQDAGTPPAAVVLLATPGRPLDALIRDQLDAYCRRLNVSEAATKRLLGRNEAITQWVREHGTIPPDVPADLAALYPRYIGRFYQGVLRHDPADLAARLSGPVLIMQGEKDLQVSAERDAPRLHAALKKRATPARADLILLPGASHNLKNVEKDGDHAFFGPAVPEFRAKLVEWLTEVLDEPRQP